MQRVRIGLTGLAFVFVLVLLAAVFVRPSAEQHITANSLDHALKTGQPAPTQANDAEPKEPLAELGVAPGNADANKAGEATQSAIAPAIRR